MHSYCCCLLIIVSMTAIAAKNINDDNGSLKNVSKYSEWTPWTKCERCWQSRVRICTSSVCKESRMFEERPCDRKRCLRQKHMKSIDKRLHIFREISKDDKKQNVYRQKIKIWSKWSPWSVCSSNCRTYRYKICKKPGRCKKKQKVESAYCFLDNSNCEYYVLQLLDGLNRKYESNFLEFQYQTNKKPPARKPLYKNCGRPMRKNKMLKIIGGRDANRNNWPWHVAILNQRNEVFCSGTLIAPRWVLTACHCVRNYLRVRLNEFDISKSDGEIEFEVAKIFRHPRFNQLTVDNDIALLKLPKSVEMPFACLPQQEPIVDDACFIMGWGKLNSKDELGWPILQEAQVPIVNFTTCTKSYRRYFISNNMFCAGIPSGKVDTCAGDSGGGLMCRAKHSTKKYFPYTVQGITSFGDGCGVRDKYGIYTNVFNYVDWIHKTIRHYTRS